VTADALSFETVKTLNKAPSTSSLVRSIISAWLLKLTKLISTARTRLNIVNSLRTIYYLFVRTTMVVGMSKNPMRGLYRFDAVATL
jgi:hypothetical protein